jgi:hypothetical protein
MPERWNDRAKRTARPAREMIHDLAGVLTVANTNAYVLTMRPEKVGELAVKIVASMSEAEVLLKRVSALVRERYEPDPGVAPGRVRRRLK